RRTRAPPQTTRGPVPSAAIAFSLSRGRQRRRDAELAKLPQTVRSAYAKFGKAEEAPKTASWQFHDNTEPEPTRWLIKDILPETGAGLISGQWGSYKTTVALDIAVALMTSTPPAGRLRAKPPAD